MQRHSDPLKASSLGYPYPSSLSATAVMRGNRRRDTLPELKLRREMHRRGLRYRCDYPIPLPGRRPVRPDIVFTRCHVAVFVDGCFWHGCPVHGSVPRSNNAYWRAKLARNRLRDRDVDLALEQAGWTSVRVWEHEDHAIAAERIATLVSDSAERS